MLQLWHQITFADRSNEMLSEQQTLFSKENNNTSNSFPKTLQKDWAIHFNWKKKKKQKKKQQKQQLQLYHDSGTIKHSENIFWRHLNKPVNV